MRSDAQVSTPFWLLGAVGLYVAIANIRGRVLPSLRIRRRWLAWLVLLVSLLFLLVALALTAGNREAAAEARRLLASRPSSGYAAHTAELKEVSVLLGGQLKADVMAEIERLGPLVEKEQASLRVEEARELACVGTDTSVDDLLARIRSIQEISESLADSSDKELCDSLAASLMDIHDQPIMSAARRRFGMKPSWNTDTSEPERDLRSAKDALLLERNILEVDAEIRRLTLAKLDAVAKHKEELAAERRKKLLASSSQSYGDLLRRPEDYVGKTLRCQGEVLQDVGDGSYRVATGKGYFGSYTEDDMFIVIDDDGEAAGTRLVEEDIIDFAGTILQPCSYTTIFGATRTIPMVSVEWIQMVKPR